MEIDCLIGIRIGLAASARSGRAAPDRSCLKIASAIHFILGREALCMRKDVLNDRCQVQACSLLLMLTTWTS